MIIHINIELDTENSGDFSRLLAFLGEDAPKIVAAAPEAPAPAPKAAPKPKSTPKAESAPAPEPEPEENLLGGGTPAELREQAVHRATELVTTGQSQKVRDALAGLEVKRVSDLTDDQLEAFLAAVA